jgi:hypothetical protein
MRTVVRLRIRLRNQKILTRMDDAVGLGEKVLGSAELKFWRLVFNGLSSRAAM